MSNEVTNEQITSSSRSHAGGGPLNNFLPGKIDSVRFCSISFSFKIEIRGRKQWCMEQTGGAAWAACRAELSWVMSSRGDTQAPDARRDNSAKGHRRLSHYPPIAVVRQWPPTMANIRCACECSCLMVIMLLRDTRTAMINGMSLLPLPLKPRKNGFIYLDTHL